MITILEDKQPNNPLVLNAWGTDHLITLDLDTYRDNGTLAIQMICYDDGYPEPWDRLTVNMSDSDTLGEDTQYVDVNHNGEEILNWIEANNLGTVTDIYYHSDWVSYPAVKFNMDEVRKHTS